jgi:peptidylprolyl isomerase
MKQSLSVAMAVALLVACLPVFLAAAFGQEPPTVSPMAKPPDVAAPPPDAAKTESGLASRVLKPGTGTEHPKATDTVTVRYTGWTTDGKMFDTSYARPTPSSLSLSRVIAGWTEGVQLMVVGEKRRFWIPEALAYKGRSGLPAGMLVFDIELVEIAAGPEMPTVPPDVDKPPSDGQRSPSGLVSKVIRPGTGTAHPRGSSSVTVHYSGWTTDGKMFDSSVARGTPATFPLDKVIPGWTEGVQLMVVGEKRRFWIPQNLAYQGQSGMPAGMLVFDVELIAINK